MKDHKMKIAVFAAGLVAGYVLQNQIEKVPVVNQLPKV